MGDPGSLCCNTQYLAGDICAVGDYVAEAAGLHEKLEALRVRGVELASQAEAVCQVGSGKSVVRT